MTRVRTTTAYRAQYDDPIGFDAGENVEVGRADAEFAGWYWCRDARGRQGWVHRSFLSALQGQAYALQAYTARELTLEAGVEADLLQRLDGWLFVRCSDGTIGWLPESRTQIIDV